MLLTCPDCTAEYNVPDHVVNGAPVTLRCVRCACEWQAGAPAPAPIALAPEPSPEPPPAPPAEAAAGPLLPALLRDPPVPLEQVHAGLEYDHALRRGLASWTVSIIAVSLIAWAAVQWRHDVMSNWPPSQRAYQAMGLN